MTVKQAQQKSSLLKPEDFLAKFRITLLVLVIFLQFLVILDLRDRVTELKAAESHYRDSPAHTVMKRNVRGTQNFRCPPGCRRLRPDFARNLYGATARRESLSQADSSRNFQGSNFETSSGQGSNMIRSGPQRVEGSNQHYNNRKVIGYTGYSGQHGSNGQSGIQGPRGPPGQPGYAGSSGIQGLPGSSGDIGYRGSPGYSGEAGRAGLPGMPRRSGSPGSPGDSGRRGTPGLPGARGSPGEPGYPGLPGGMGEPGYPGSPRESGYRGSPGEPGYPGSPGGIGEPGYPGLPGGMGEPGYPGSPGGIGEPGYPGSPGGIGEPGRPGSPGQSGDRGYPGRSGLPGGQGATGQPGEPGGRGSVGEPGYPGRAGLQQGLTGSGGSSSGHGGYEGRGSPGSSGQLGTPGQIGYNDNGYYRNPVTSGGNQPIYDSSSGNHYDSSVSRGPELRARIRGDQGTPRDDELVTEENVQSTTIRTTEDVLKELRLLDHPKCVDNLNHQALMDKLKNIGKVSFMIMVDLEDSVYCIVHAD